MSSQAKSIPKMGTRMTKRFDNLLEMLASMLHEQPYSTVEAWIIECMHSVAIHASIDAYDKGYQDGVKDSEITEEMDLSREIEILKHLNNIGV